MILGLKWDLDTMELLDHINSFLRIKPNKKRLLNKKNETENNS